MRKIFLLVLFLSCLTAIGQTYYPPFAVAGQNPSGTLVFVGTDASGNLYTNGTGSSGAPTVVSGYIPPVAMTGQNPSGVQVYLKTDANGNLYVNCQTGCSGGGGGYTLQIAGVSLTASDTVNFNASTPAAGSNGINVTFQTSKASTTDSVSAEIVGDGTSTHYLSGVGTWTTPSGVGGGGAFPQTVSGTTTSGGITYFSNTTTLSSSGILNTNVLVQGGGAGGAPTNSSVTDNGTSVTTTDTGGYVGPVFTANGSTAGFFDYPQGSTSAAVAPCNTANSICEQAPTSVTAYILVKPAAQPAANNNFIFCTAANPTVCSFAQVLWSELGNAGGALTLANGTNATTFNQTSAVNWTWANTTAATVSLNNQAPIFNLLGQAWEGGSLANTTDGFTIQSVFCNTNVGTCPSNANNPYPTLIIQDAITASTHYPSVTLQGANFFYNPTTHSSNIGGGLQSSSGSYSIMIGQATAATPGSGDIAIGYQALTNASSSGSNVAIGYNSLSGCTSCTGLVAIGLSTAGSGSYSEIIGDSASSSSFTDDVVIGTSVVATKSHQTLIGTSTTTDALVQGWLHSSANSVALGSATTITSATFVTTGLALPVIPISTTVNGRCSIIWEQSTATNTVQFGMGMNNAPTDLYAMSTLHSGTSGSTLTDQYTTITNTTTTAISATGAPGATATGYKEEIDFTLVTGASNSVILTVYALTGNTSDAVVIEPGSSCGWTL